MSENATCSATIQCLGPLTCSSFRCKCGSYEYHNETSLTCISQKSINGACSVDYNCRSDRGLQCRSGLCECVSQTPIWSSSLTKCIKPGNYTEPCTSNSECDSSLGLVCNSGGNACNCPTVLGNNFCDCVKRNNDENYWDGTRCITAASYGQACVANINYSCKTITQNTICDSNGLCSCSSNGGLRASDSKCISCALGWYYINEKCYRVGTATGGSDTSGINSGCPNGQGTVSLADTSSPAVLNFFMTNVTTGQYWINMYKVTITWCGSLTYSSCRACSGCWSINCCSSGNKWCSSASWNDCVYYDVAADCYMDTWCSNTKGYFCQYDA